MLVCACNGLWHAAEFGFDAAVTRTHTAIVRERGVVLVGDASVFADGFEREIGVLGGLLGGRFGRGSRSCRLGGRRLRGAGLSCGWFRG